MTKYRGTVVFRYYQEVEVEADNEEDALLLMQEKFDLSKAEGVGDVEEWEEVKDE
jgi:hypothetical protein